MVEMDAHTKMREGGRLLTGQWQGLPSPCVVPLLTEQVKEKAKDLQIIPKSGGAWDVWGKSKQKEVILFVRARRGWEAQWDDWLTIQQQLRVFAWEDIHCPC